MESLVPEAERPHAVCIPYPAQGHVTPMLQLSKLLHARGFHVTFVNTEFNHRRLLHSRGAAALDGVPGFRFAAIPDGLPPSDADATQDIPALCYSTMTNCLPHLLSLLARINSDSAVSGAPPPVTCLVVDGVMSFGYDAAREIGVPVAALWTASACGYMGYRNYRQLVDWGLVPFNNEAQLADVAGGHLATVVHGASGMCDGVQLRDFPNFIRTTDRGDIMFNFLMRESERLSLPDAVMINTFEDLEGTTLDAMRAILPPMHPVGPLILQERRTIPADSPLAGLGSNLWKEQGGLLEWLGGRAPRSVVYVNYGSITVMTKEQLLEFAWGIAGSGYPFVWNIRPDLLKGDAAVLPPEFLSSVEGRALLTTWCPQEAALQHEAVGVFLTHSGWNSTLESLCAGVPMLSWPFFAEQQTNCRYKRTEWGVGMEIGGEVRRGEVAAIIREAMDGEKGQEMRRRAEEWKEKAVKATLPGGPAEVNLDRLIDEVLLAQRKKGQAVNGRN
ncbi:7-deoxyloganetin glucosyltransferase-like [Phragmites australis]|uniref:7-deoxyloganetin glucosyltransferase-like n=1 Tax=Phragmites australis TaxID=29695 RepID=UPI002D79CC79|nr:7-deoxyloganetin glucosyltransferase-like [Phragmites australis]